MGIGTNSVLSKSAMQIIQYADIIIGRAVYLASLPHLKAEKIVFPHPISALWDIVQAHAGKQIVILASGDPLFFGIGSTLLRQFPIEILRFYPNLSSVQTLCSRLGQPWHAIKWISLHGKPISTLKAVLHSNRQYAILTDHINSPIAIAKIVVASGFGESDIWVGEQLGTKHEKINFFKAKTLSTITTIFSTLNVIVLHTRGQGILPEFPGIPDTVFSTTGSSKGLLSKREVRLNILSLLAPRAGDIGWDIGAGCGGVAVEWARWNSSGRIYAIEYHHERIKHLYINREYFGVTENLSVIPEYAPQALVNLPDPNAVFIGGSSGNLIELLRYTWERLQPGGRLVASAVTESSRVNIYHFVADKQSSLVELSIARRENLSGHWIMKPYLPVLLMQLEKKEGE